MRNVLTLLVLVAVCAIALVGYLAMHPRTETAMTITHQYQRVIPNTTEANQATNQQSNSVFNATTASETMYPSTTNPELVAKTHSIGPAVPVQVDTIESAEASTLLAEAKSEAKNDESKVAATPKPVRRSAPFLPPGQKREESPIISSFNKSGVYVLGKEVHKNGFHQGEPTVVVVDKGSHFTYVLQKQFGDRVVIVDRVSNAVGTDETPSPPGPYKVARIVKMPVWTPPKSIDKKQKPVQPYNKDRKNPLGVAIITLNKFEVALHGTNDPDSIRKNESHGCIRHSNDDIIKLVNKVKKGTTVIITNKFVGTKISKKMFGSQTTGKK